MHPLDALEMKLARPVAVVDACMRQELSAATQTFARVAITWRRLSVRIALETSALLTANVPAEPAALPRVRELHEVAVTHGAQQPQRATADLEQPQRMARRVIRGTCANVAPTSSTPSSSTSSSESSNTRGASAATSLARRASPAASCR